MKKLMGLLAAVSMLSGISILSPFIVSAEEKVENLNVAILMDASGSILDSERPSDPDLTSRDAARSFVNLIPTNGATRVSLFQFSNDLDQVAELTTVDADESYRQLGNAISGMTHCANATHMVSSITEVCKYLDQNSDENTRNVLIVFTDGAENGVLTAATATDEKIRETVNNSIGDTGVEVYSLAYDYLDDDGNHSVGDIDGYGYRLLKEYAEQTGGTVEVAENVDQFKDKFCKVLASLSGGDLPKITKITDGTFETDLEIVEADISVHINDAEKIVLTKPDGKIVDLNDKNDNIWVQNTKSSVDIKIISPDVGKWKISVEGVKPENVDIDLLRYYDLSMKISTTLNGNEVTSVTPGDRLHLESVLYSAGNAMNPQDLYELNNMEAYAYVSDNTSLKNEVKNKTAEEISTYLKRLEGVQSFALGITDTAFTADIPIENNGANLISVLINSGNFYCYDEVLISGDGSIFPIKTPETVYVSNGYSTEIPMFSENYSSSSADVKMNNEYDNSLIDAELVNNTLKINGRMAGSTILDFTFTAKDGSSSFDLKIPVVVSNAIPVVDFDGESYTLDAGEKLSIKDLAARVSDYEKDTITITLSDVSDDTIIDASYVDDILTLEGLTAGESTLTLDVSDGENIVQATVYVKVRKAMVFRILPFIIGLIALAIIALVALLLRKKGMKLRNSLYELRVTKNGDEIIAPVNVDIQKNMADILRQDAIRCNDDEFLTLKVLSSITFTGTNKSNQTEVIELKKNILVAMEYMDDYAPEPVEYSFGVTKKTKVCSNDGTPRYFRIDIRSDATAEQPDYTITFNIKML